MKYTIETNGEYFRVRYEDGSFLMNRDEAYFAVFGSKLAAMASAAWDKNEIRQGPWVEV